MNLETSIHTLVIDVNSRLNLIRKNIADLKEEQGILDKLVVKLEDTLEELQNADIK